MKPELMKLLLTELLGTDTQIAEPQNFNCDSHKAAIDDWIRGMESGTLIGRPFSPITVLHYSKYVEEYFRKYNAITVEDLKRELEITPAKMYGRKSKYFRAILCFAKYLIREGRLQEGFVEKAAQFKPKRHLPPKQVSLTLEQLESVQKACSEPRDAFIVALLSNTGLRASEFCDLTLGDIHLEEGYLIVRKGKGGKRRRVGLNPEAKAALIAHLRRHPDMRPEDALTCNSEGDPITRFGVLNRMRSIAKRIGLDFSPHALRRSFVTINANKGRSLVMLQLACGHSDIATTRSYCKTSEDEMISAMKDWD